MPKQPLTATLSRLLFALAVLAPSAGSGLSVEDSVEITGWHVVRPGETLQTISALYLGSGESWRDNLELNPGLENPHLLFPGQRLRVILKRGLPTGSAQVTTVSQRAEQQPTPIRWREALQEDLLHRRDGVRTYKDSSVQLRFADGSNVTVGEDSLLFLRGVSSGSRVQRRSEEIEIVAGQADLKSSREVQEPSEIEIVVGSARARPVANAQGQVEARARLSDSRQSQVMVYSGSGAVESSGETVELPEGTGTSVPDAGPPGPPVPLLPAPAVTYPPGDAQLGFSNAHFAWGEVAGAESYVVELCSDAKCAGLLRRHEGLSGERLLTDGVPPGSYF